MAAIGVRRKAVGLLGVVASGSVLLLLLAPALSGPGPGGARTLPPPRATAPHPSIGIAAAEVVPQALTVASGGMGNFSLWSGSGDPYCAVETPVVVWQLSPTVPPIGTLTSPSGTSVGFTAFPGATGTATVSVTVEGWVLCGSDNVSFGTDVQASVTTVPPLEITNLTGGTAPAAPGTAVACSGTLSGGEPPYRLEVDFGDGNSSSLLLGAAGRFSLLHRYSTGTYLPTVSASDALGDRTSTQAESAVLVANALAAEIEPAGPGPEAGAPFTVQSIAEGGYPPYTYLWTDSSGDAATGPAWTLTSSSAGPLGVELAVTDRLGEVTEVGRQFEVSAPVLAQVAGESGDVGRPLLFRLALSGGVPPFSVAGTSVPSGSSFAFTAYSDGNYSGAVVPASATSLWLEVEVTDALGLGWSETVPLAVVHAAPVLLANLSPNPAEAGAALEVVGLASGGTPPFNWTIASTVALTGASPRFGRLAGDGSFFWNGSAPAAGSGELLLSLVDASGAEVGENLSLRALPALAASLLLEAAAPSAGVPLPFGFSIAGGAAPYRYSFQLSDGLSYSGNLSLAGPGSWTAPAAPTGFLLVRFTVVDALGFLNQSALTVAIGPGPPSPGSSPGSPGPNASGSGSVGAAAWAGWLFLPAAALFGGLWFLRSRRPARSAAPATEPTGALPTVRRLLREMDGLDSESLELLAEEEGIDPESSRRALERWIALGRVESLEDPEEPAVYRWKEPPSRGRSDRPDRTEDRP